MGKPKRKKFVKLHHSNLSQYKLSSEQTNQSSVSLKYYFNDSSFWIAHWQILGQPWRTEPEIDSERQAYLAKCCATTPDIVQGIYPFKNVKLSRADIEWLLVTYGNESINRSNEHQLKCKGLDLRGADLRQVDLSCLPLARLRGGLTGEETGSVTIEQREAASVHLEKAKLCQAHLEEAYLWDAHLEDANMREVHLEKADLYLAHLEQAHLFKAHLEGADLSRAHLEGASLSEAHLEGVHLSEAHLEGVSLSGAHLEGAYLFEAHLEGAYLSDAHLEGAHLFEAHLDRGRMSGAHLEGKLMPIDDLRRVRKWVKNFPSSLPPADLRRAFFDAATYLGNAILGEEKFGFISLADIHWGDTDLSVVNWSMMKMLGDERFARRAKIGSKVKDTDEQLKEHLAAVRANRQLATALQSQGLNEEAARFAYRAQRLQRIVLWQQSKFGQYLFSLFLDLLSGFGYKPVRSFLAYLIVISLFMAAYHILNPHLMWNEALVISMTAFHGRGFFPGTFSPGDPLALASAVEAFIGLIIEVTFIATLTQRLFGK